jgi:hypothetical protein
MDNFVKCPKCDSIDWIRKGKTIDKKYQKLRCKRCKKNWKVESFLVNKQINIPETKFAIISHPDKTFSINKVSISNLNNSDISYVRNLEFVTSKVDTYKKIVELASNLTVEIHPNPIKLDQYISDGMRYQLNILFPQSIAKGLENLMESMCKDLSWNN